MELDRAMHSEVITRTSKNPKWLPGHIEYVTKLIYERSIPFATINQYTNIEVRAKHSK
jgi:hypothetical protein